MSLKPTFATLINGAPLGFVQGCSLIKRMSVDNHEQYIASIIKSMNICNNLASLSSSCSNSNSSSDYNDMVKALLYIIRSRSQANTKPTSQEFASILDANTVLSRDSIATLIEEIDKYETDSDNKNKITINNISNAGALVDFQWKFGVALCSNTCKNLSSPYISIAMTIKDVNGDTKAHTAELTYTQFKTFRATFQNAADAINNL